MNKSPILHYFYVTNIKASALNMSRRFFMSALPKAFLPEEGGAAQAVTEGAARGQICAKDNLIRQAHSPHRLLGSPFGRAGICEAND